MTELDFPVFDCDNHYYEAVDAFTRHLDPRTASRTIEWCTINGRQYHVIGGKVSHAVVNPTFDPVALPGVLKDYFRGNPNNENPIELLKQREPIRPAYRDKDARIATLDEHGLEKCWLFPTLGMIYEEPLHKDPWAVMQVFTAFNRWMLEDWSFNHKDRIFTAPYITLVDVDWAVNELKFALDNGATTVVMRPAAPTTVDGQRSPADPMFDPFWGLVNESGITVVAHAGDSGYTAHGYGEDNGFSAGFGQQSRPQPLRMATMFDRPIEDFLGSLSATRCSTASRTSESHPSKTVQGSFAVCSRSSTTPQRRCRAGSLSSLRKPSAATSGSTHSGKTMSTRLLNSWVPIA